MQWIRGKKLKRENRIRIANSLMHLKKLGRGFYLRPTLVVARDLPGKYFVRRLRGETLVGKIVEVEAYLGELDPASHAFRGKTKRNEVMFRRGGHLYVYFTYGMHFCCNVVAEGEGLGRAILVRALEPLRGISRMTLNRNAPLDNLCNGPAKLCQALNIGRPENGTDLCRDQIWIAENTVGEEKGSIGRSTRVGITDGIHHRWRYYLKGSKFISPGKPV